jgi:lysophospholipase L1-like esterase
MAVLSDSIANDPADWPYLFATRVATAFPAYTVRWYPWSDATLDAGAPTTIQTGTAGERYVPFTSSGHSLQLPATDASGTPVDLDVSVRASLDDWTPAAQMVLTGRENGAGSRSWWFNVETNGTLALNWSNDGTTLLTVFSSVAPTVVDGAILWVRATLDVNDGAGNRVIKFYTSTDGATWTQLGTTTTTVGTTVVFDPTTNASYSVGARGSSGGITTGKIYEVRVRGTVAGATTATGVNALNSTTVNVGATASFPSSGVFIMGGVSTTYTGVTGTSFTGCGNHAATTGGEAIIGSPGPVLLPTLPEHWNRVDALSPSVVGAPVFTMLAAAQSGGGLSYLSNATRLALLLRDYALRAVFMATSHNDGITHDRVWQALWASWITAVKNQAYEAAAVVMTENPEFSPMTATAIADHAIKREKLLALASLLREASLDGFQAFLDTGSPSTYINADGVHPTTSGNPSGAQLLANYAYAALFGP